MIKMKLKFSLSTWVIIAMILGLICGLMFGDLCAKLRVVGDIYVNLLLMCVMPYIVTTLICGIGRLDLKNAKLIAIKGGIITILFWSIAIFFVLLMPATFPEWESSGFYRGEMISSPPPVDSLGLYISSNPFNAMAESLVPAVVLFCVCVGIALISVPGKKKLLDNLSIFGVALEKVTTFMVKLAPLGTFAITAVAAGTMTLDEIARLQVYFITFIAAALLMTFIIFPLIITTFTSYTYKEIFKVSKEVLLIAFATSNLFILLPLITRDTRVLMKSHGYYNEERDTLNDIIIPICYIFPCTGKLLTILFVMFAAWFDGVTIEYYRYPEFIATSLLSFMGSANFAIPFLLNHFHISSDLFDVYLMAGIINGKFATLLAAVYLLGFTLVCNAWITGLLKVDMKKIVKNSIVIVICTVATLLGTSYILGFTPKTNTELKDMLASMKVQRQVKTVVLKKYPETSILEKVFASKPGSNRLREIKKRGVIRVGYNPNARPFTYFNAKEELIGFDIAMANQLAKDLNCTLEFIPIKYDDIGKGVDSNTIDIAMAGISKTVKRIETLDFSNAYLVVTLAFVTRDHETNKYLSSRAVKNMNISIAVLEGSAYKDLTSPILPKATFISLKSIDEFFTGKVEADVLLTTAEQGSAYCMLYPKFDVVVPKPDLVKDNFAYAIAQNDLAFSKFINEWLAIKRNNNTIKKLYNYWILGKNLDYKKPRWSIWNNVLGMNKNSKKRSGAPPRPHFRQSLDAKQPNKPAKPAKSAPKKNGAEKTEPRIQKQTKPPAPTEPPVPAATSAKQK
ncbi:MAG: cation:dicarboxylase symporter family transporter [Kiritimatiellaeota bacterium]|nr:cation:dicarboxylase symporter family transporter [Kiritimatiellota bacterium]